MNAGILGQIIAQGLQQKKPKNPLIGDAEANKKPGFKYKFQVRDCRNERKSNVTNRKTSI